MGDAPASSDSTQSDGEASRTWSVRKLTPAEQSELKRDKTLVRDSRWNTTGMVSLVVFAFVLGRWPWNFWILHFIFMGVLLPFRYYQFREKGQELYLLDFCYFGGAYFSAVGTGIALLRVTTGLETWLAPYNAMLFRALFAFASGPLAVSTYLFSNAMVLFHPGHATSVWIHTSPAITVWAVRWGGGFGFSAFDRAWPGLAAVCPGVDPVVADECMLDLWCNGCPAKRREFILYPVLFYIFFWMIPYYLVLFVVLRGWIERTGKSTLFGDYVAADNAGGRWLRARPTAIQPLVYLLFHALHVVLSSGIGWLFWHSFPLHTAFVVVTVFFTIVNGSSYIFKVFSLRYYAERVEAARAREAAKSAGLDSNGTAKAKSKEADSESARQRLMKVAAVVVPYFAILVGCIRNSNGF